MLGRKIFSGVPLFSKRLWGGVIAFIIAAGIGPSLFDVVTKKFFLENKPPVAVIKVTLTRDTVPFKRLFDGTQSSDHENGEMKFQWSVDGEVVSSGKYFRYEFTQPREYLVVLEVKDDQGGSDEHSVIIVALPGEKKIVSSLPPVTQKTSDVIVINPTSKKETVQRNVVESSGANEKNDESLPSGETVQHGLKETEEQTEVINNIVVYKMVTQKFKGVTLMYEYENLIERVPKLLEHWLALKMSSQKFTVLGRELYQEITEEFEFENKRKKDFDSSTVVKKLRRLGANVVLVGTIEQYVPSEEIIINAKIVSLETAVVLAEWTRPIEYRNVNLRKYNTLSGQLNRIAEDLHVILKGHEHDSALARNIELLNRVFDYNDL